jgi:hypothetical protein
MNEEYLKQNFPIGSFMEVSHDESFIAEFVDDANVGRRTAGENYERHGFRSDGGKITFAPSTIGIWHIFVHLPEGKRRNLLFSFRR